jgi:hypothetical protein
MCATALKRIMMPMTRPLTASKVLLVADRRSAASEAGPAPVRRYRLARLRYDNRPTRASTRGDQFKRI